jgi:hypothetical protein
MAVRAWPWKHQPQVSLCSHLTALPSMLLVNSIVSIVAFTGMRAHVMFQCTVSK